MSRRGVLDATMYLCCDESMMLGCVCAVCHFGLSPHKKFYSLLTTIFRSFDTFPGPAKLLPASLENLPVRVLWGETRTI